MVKKIICRKAPENFSKNLSSSACKNAMDMEGKTAVERDTATAFTIIEERLFARLKIAMEPDAKVEAMAVMATVFNWPAPRPRERGAISPKVFETPGCLKLKSSLYLNPENINAGTCINKCKPPPSTTPHANPLIPIAG